jgi:hypothetical protein
MVDCQAYESHLFSFLLTNINIFYFGSEFGVWKAKFTVNNMTMNNGKSEIIRKTSSTYNTGICLNGVGKVTIFNKKKSLSVFHKSML